MDKSIVLNVCGVKSLGGLKVIATAIDDIKKSDYKIILLHNNNLTQPMNIESEIQKIETNLSRYCHPYLNIFMSRKHMNTINSSAAIIHFGNFGFKTKNKSYTFIQNLLPLEVNNLKNIILKYFINRSLKQSNHIIYQLDHVADKIKVKFKDKLIKIGIIDKSTKKVNPEAGIIGIQSQILNKNSEFIEKVFQKMMDELPDLKITKFISEETKPKNGENSTSLLESFYTHNIYFHASFFETVGLPLYEASSAGLFIVAPDTQYMNYFDNSNSMKYKTGDLESATTSLKKVLNAKKKSLQALSYRENWKTVLESI